MSFHEKVLLDAKTDNTPGDPVDVHAWVNIMHAFVRKSSDYTAGSTFDYRIEYAYDPAGPWVDLGGNGVGPNPSEANFDAFQLIKYVPYLRAKLLGNPSTGSVSASVFLLPLQ